MLVTMAGMDHPGVSENAFGGCHSIQNEAKLSWIGVLSCTGGLPRATFS